MTSSITLLLAALAVGWLAHGARSCETAAASPADVAHAASFWDACTDPEVDHIRLLADQSWEDFASELRAPCAIDRALLLEAGWGAGGRAMRLNMEGMVDKLVVTRGADLHIKDVWLDNFLSSTRPYLAPLALTVGGRAVFENVEFSDGKCTETENSNGIQGLLRSLGWALYGSRDPEKPDGPRRVTLVRPTILAGLAWNSSYRFINCTLTCTGIGPHKPPKSGFGQQYFPLIGSWIVGILVAIISIRFLWLAVPGLLESPETETQWRHADGIPEAVATQAERYHVRLIEPLGQGMFGKVYKGIFDREYVAVKVLEFAVQGERSTTTALAEISLATSLLHPHVVETHLCIVDVISVGDLAATAQPGFDTGMAVGTYQMGPGSLGHTPSGATALQMSQTRPPTDSYEPVPFPNMTTSSNEALLGTATSQHSSRGTSHSGNSGAMEEWLERQRRSLQNDHRSPGALPGSFRTHTSPTQGDISRQLLHGVASMSVPDAPGLLGEITDAAMTPAQSPFNLDVQRRGGSMPSTDFMASFTENRISTAPGMDGAGVPSSASSGAEGIAGHSSAIERSDHGERGLNMRRVGPQQELGMSAVRSTPSKPVPIPMPRGLADVVSMPTERRLAVMTNSSPLASGLQQAHQDRAWAGRPSNLSMVQSGQGSTRGAAQGLLSSKGRMRGSSSRGLSSTAEAVPESVSYGSADSWVRLADPSPSHAWERSPDSNSGLVGLDHSMTSCGADALQGQSPTLVPLAEQIPGPTGSGSGGFLTATEPHPNDTTSWQDHGQALGLLRVGDAADSSGPPRVSPQGGISIPDMSEDERVGPSRTGSSTVHLTESLELLRPKPAIVPQDSAMSHGVLKPSSSSSLPSVHLPAFRSSEESAYDPLMRLPSMPSEWLGTSPGLLGSNSSYTAHLRRRTGTDSEMTSGSSEFFGHLEGNPCHSTEDARADYGVPEVTGEGAELQEAKSGETPVEGAKHADNRERLTRHDLPASSKVSSFADAAIAAPATLLDVLPAGGGGLPVLGHWQGGHAGLQPAGSGPVPFRLETLSSSPPTTEGSSGGHEAGILGREPFPTPVGASSPERVETKPTSRAGEGESACALQVVRSGADGSESLPIRTSHNSHMVLHMHRPGAGPPEPMVGLQAPQTGSQSAPLPHGGVLPVGSWPTQSTAANPSPPSGPSTSLGEVSVSHPGPGLAPAVFGHGMRTPGSSFSRRGHAETLPPIEEGQAPLYTEGSSALSEESVQVPPSAFLGHGAASSPLAAEHRPGFYLDGRSFSGAHDPLGRIESDIRTGSDVAAFGAPPDGDEARLGSVHSESLGPLRAYRCMIVMEFCDKGTLWAALRQQIFHSQRGRPDMALILRIALEIAQAMEHLHSLRILHRDITSKNILLQTGREDGLIHAKVSDFGLSVLLETDQAYATTQQRGTLGYCGPEVLSGDQLSLETDVYSFGVILWELYTAATPYDGMNEMQIVLRKVLGPDLDPPATCPAAYAHLMLECMQRNAPARPSFKIIARALETLGSLAWE